MLERAGEEGEAGSDESDSEDGGGRTPMEGSTMEEGGGGGDRGILRFIHVHMMSMALEICSDEFIFGTEFSVPRIHTVTIMPKSAGHADTISMMD